MTALSARNEAARAPLIATFSIAARDAETGDLGVAVASKFLAVGAFVPAVRAGIGAVASQARTNMSYGPRALELLGQGMAPEECSRVLRADDRHPEARQLGIVSAVGSSSTYTGAACKSWAGGVAGPDFAAQGNILTGPEVVTALVEVFQCGELAFPERLLAALAAAEEAGGDSRGRQSAALVLAGSFQAPGGRIDLRIDDHLKPVAELARLLQLARQRW